MNTLLEVKSLSYTPPAGFIFPGSRNDEILRNISFTINKGSITGIAGESGSGKTTLAKILAGILPPSSGSIVFNISPKWKKVKTSPVQILFQNNGGILNPFRTIFDAVKEIYEIRNGKNPESINKVKEIMDLVNLPESLYNNKGFQLSGGEQQRAAIAKVIAAKPGLLILDEPFSAQDPESRFNLFNLFKRINEDYDVSMICISHNLKLLKKLCSHILVMYKGEIVEQGAGEDIFNAPSHPYTKYLLKAENYDLSYPELQQIPVK